MIGCQCACVDRDLRYRDFTTGDDQTTVQRVLERGSPSTKQVVPVADELGLDRGVEWELDFGIEMRGLGGRYGGSLGGGGLG